MYTLSKTSISIVSQVGRQHKSRNQGAEDGMASLSLTPVPHVPLGDSVFPTPAGWALQDWICWLADVEYSF